MKKDSKSLDGIELRDDTYVEIEKNFPKSGGTLNIKKIPNMRIIDLSDEDRNRRIESIIEETNIDRIDDTKLKGKKVNKISK